MTTTQAPEDLEKLLSEAREEARWRMNLAKNARLYFTKEYIKRKEAYIKYDNLYKMIEGK